ncbi:MAG: ABC transporter permease, partial [Butyribacter sp.]|nr:ABC transporter permease [Butyribacter sp.]
MVKYSLKRIGMAIITTLIVIIILFFLLQFMPGSPFNNERLTADQISILNEKYGLDKPMVQRIVIYVKNMCT